MCETTYTRRKKYIIFQIFQYSFKNNISTFFCCCCCVCERWSNIWFWKYFLSSYTYITKKNPKTKQNFILWEECEWMEYLSKIKKEYKKINNILKTTKIVIFQIMYACRKKIFFCRKSYSHTYKRRKIYT